MAQKYLPELYLSLLSGRDGDLSDKAIASRCQSDHPLPKYPDHLLDVLDALAAICVRNKGDVFFVSLAVDPNSTTLHVGTNGTVPATLITHLHKIQGQLKKLDSVAASSPLTLATLLSHCRSRGSICSDRSSGGFKALFLLHLLALFLGSTNRHDPMFRQWSPLV